jgi:hypothetical protein
MSKMAEQTKAKSEEDKVEDLPEVPGWELQKSSQGGFSVKYQGTNQDLIRYYMKEFGLDATDFYVNKGGEVCIKKNGRFKIAAKQGWKGGTPSIEKMEGDMVVIKYECDALGGHWSDLGFCNKGEKPNEPLVHIFETATTRAILRTIEQFAPLKIALGQEEEDGYIATQSAKIAADAIEKKVESNMKKAEKEEQKSPVKKETKKADHTDQPEPVKAESKKEIQTMNGTDPDDPPKNESKQTFKGALFNAVTRYQESHPTEMKTLTLAAQMIQESEGLSKEESLFVAIFDGDNHHPTIEDLNQLDGLDLEIATKMIKYWEPHNNEAKLEDAINSAPKKTTTPEHELKYYVVDQCDEVTDKAYKYNCKFVEVNAEFSEHIGEPFYANIFENNLNGEALKQGYIVQAVFYQKGKYWNLYKDAFKIVARD